MIVIAHVYVNGDVHLFENDGLGNFVRSIFGVHQPNLRIAAYVELGRDNNGGGEQALVQAIAAVSNALAQGLIV